MNGLFVERVNLPIYKKKKRRPSFQMIRPFLYDVPCSVLSQLPTTIDVRLYSYDARLRRGLVEVTKLSENCIKITQQSFELRL